MGTETAPGIRVLLADSKPMENQLLAGGLRHQGFQVFPSDIEIASVLDLAEHIRAEVAVLSCSSSQTALADMTPLRTPTSLIRESLKFF
jgi:hypothetical protein